MKRLSKLTLFLFTFIFFSCLDKQKELDKGISRIWVNDTIWCESIDSTGVDYKLYRYYRSDNSIWGLNFFNSKFNVSTSEMYSFDKKENLRFYYILDRNSKNRYGLRFDGNKRFVESQGNMNVFLDSVSYDKNQEYLMFFTFPRIPYYKINPVFYFFNDTSNNEIDTIFPILQKNCHIMLSVGNKLPKLIHSSFQYNHVNNSDKFTLSFTQSLDTIKLVKFPEKLDVFYLREIDYQKFPFIK